jgi:calcineurin-like phosphoesterase family protein
MQTFFTFDQHYGHHNIIEYCGRPFKSASHMNEELIRRHNEVVQPDDVVYHLGDFAMRVYTMEVVLPRLNGYHYLVPGNHDGCHPRHKKKQNITRYEQAGFEVLPHFTSITLSDMAVDLCHIPHTSQDPRYPDYKAKPTRNVLLCGHVHEKWKILDRQINVGVDVWDYTPVRAEKLVEIILSIG